MKFKKALIILIITVFTFGFISGNVYAAHDIYYDNEPGSEAKNNDTSDDTKKEDSDKKNDSDKKDDSSNKSEQTGENDEPYYMDSNCKDLAPALRIVALIIKIVRVAIPLIIIIMGTFKFLPAILSASSGDLGKTAIDLFKRVILAALIFFTPSIINTFVKVMTTDQSTDINVCRRCLFENDCPEAEDNIYNAN